MQFGEILWKFRVPLFVFAPSPEAMMRIRVGISGLQPSLPRGKGVEKMGYQKVVPEISRKHIFPHRSHGLITRF